MSDISINDVLDRFKLYESALKTNNTLVFTKEPNPFTLYTDLSIIGKAISLLEGIRDNKLQELTEYRNKAASYEKENLILSMELKATKNKLNEALKIINEIKIKKQFAINLIETLFADLEETQEDYSNE